MKTTLLLTAALCITAYASEDEECGIDERFNTYSQEVDLDGVEPLETVTTSYYIRLEPMWPGNCANEEYLEHSEFTHVIEGLATLYREFQAVRPAESFGSGLNFGDTDGDGDKDVLHDTGYQYFPSESQYEASFQFEVLDEDDPHVPVFTPDPGTVTWYHWLDLNGDGLHDFDLGSAGQFINQGPGASPRYLRSDLIPPPPPLFEEGKLFEYAFGEVEPVVEFGRDKSLSIQYQRRQDTPVRYAIETSTNLRQWHAGNLQETVEDLGNGWERVSASYSPPSFAGVGYARVTARFTAP